MPGNSIGQRLVLTSFGESHGKSIGAILDGCPAGLEIDEKRYSKNVRFEKTGPESNFNPKKRGRCG